MNIHIIRRRGNRTRTQGELYVNGRLVCLTMEGRMPKEGECWKNQLLPPGTYRGLITIAPIKYRGETIYAEWPELKAVRYFPRAGFYADHPMGARGGAIIVGTEAPSGFELTGNEEAARQLARVCHEAAREDGSRLSVTIEGDISTVEYDDMSITDWERDRQAEEERKKMERLKHDFFA